MSEQRRDCSSHPAPKPLSPAVRRRMQQTEGRDTTPELALRSELHRVGLRFRLHRALLPGSTRRADIVLVASRTAVFVDGCFWHGCPRHGSWPKNNAAWWREKITKNRRRDRDTDRRLRSAGWTVVRSWAHEAPAAAALRITKLIGRRGAERTRVIAIGVPKTQEAGTRAAASGRGVLEHDVVDRDRRRGLAHPRPEPRS